MNAAIHLQAMGCLSALGHSADAMRSALFATQYPDTLVSSQAYSPGRPLTMGGLPGHIALPALDHVAPRLRSRNNALALAAADQIREPVARALAKYGATRVALVVGTSTSGVSEGEAAALRHSEEGQFPHEFDYAVQEVGNVGEFLAAELGIHGPAYVISTACSSGAKALATAGRLIRAGIADAVVAGGVDALCSFTVAGFSALESVSATRCNPSSAHRCGINLGEGAAFFLLGREPGPVRLAGWGESQDAHHMSAPDPQGRGAITAMSQALQRAQTTPDQIDYVNLHGTATPHNDAMEHHAVHAVLGGSVWASSTKPLTGHTLAAAGAIEAAIAWHVLLDNDEGRLPVHWWDGHVDPTMPPLALVATGTRLGRPPRHVMSNSFAFGGNNVALLFAAT